MRIFVKIISSAAVAFCLTTFTARADNCSVINAIPHVIRAPGNYCVASDLEASLTGGKAISIASDNVTLDLQGHAVKSRLDSGDDDGVGIYAFGKMNVVVKNGSVIGFKYGIWLNDDVPYKRSHDNIVENITVDASGQIGIWILGANNIVRNNHVSHSGKSALNTETVYGILSSGNVVHIHNNDVSEMRHAAGSTANSIAIRESKDAFVENNRLTNITNGDGMSFGINVSQSNNVSINSNVIAGMTHGVFFDKTSDGKYVGNVTTEMMVRAYTGGQNGDVK